MSMLSALGKSATEKPCNTIDTLIGGKTELKGDIVFSGGLRIDGKIRGNITAKRSVEIHSPGKVKGNINTPSLFIEKGVFFDGHCQMDSGASASESSHTPRHSGGKKSAEKAPANPASATGGSNNSTT